MRRTIVARALIALLFAGVASLLWTQIAFAAPAVNYAGFDRHIAYELKSMQRTVFHAQVNTVGVYAVLKVATMRGDVVLFRGGIDMANRDVTLASWNGMGPDGRPLPSSGAYVWTLTISKGGHYASSSGTISVSRIRFQLSSGAFPGSKPIVFSRYMIPGNANVYVFANVEGDDSGTPATGSLAVRIHGVAPGAYTRSVPSTGSYRVDSTRLLRATAYLGGSNSIPDRGMHPVVVTATAPQTVMEWMVVVIQ